MNSRARAIELLQQLGFKVKPRTNKNKHDKKKPYSGLVGSRKGRLVIKGYPTKPVALVDRTQEEIMTERKRKREELLSKIRNRMEK